MISNNMNIFQNQSNSNNILNNSIFVNSEFIEPNHEINWKYSLQNTFHFKQDIERIWLIIRSFELLCTLSDIGNYPVIITKGKDSWKEGNEFKGIFLGMVPFVGKVQSKLDLPEMKKIEWLLRTINNRYFNLTIELYKVTENNSTVAIKKFQFENEKMKIEAEKSKIYR